MTKPVIIGDGLAALTVALSLAPMPVILLSPRKLGFETASSWAQGGIAAAVGDDDTPALHAKDTIAAGAGLCDLAVVGAVTDDGPKSIEFLENTGVKFQRDAKGGLQLGLEAAHSRRRIVHAADQTGSHIISALVKAVRKTPSIEVMEETIALEICADAKKVTGVLIKHRTNSYILMTNKVVLATGGAGALWRNTSNPLGSWGSGLLLASLAGATLGDLEFMQFHPTAIDIGRDPMPLASEALRGEGCTLINEKGDRFIDELKPRDVVARAIWAERTAGRKTFLDGRKALGSKFAKRFPAIYKMCMSAEINPAKFPIPVSPAAHYHMGGVVTDLHGRTNIEGLWACGEVACTGLHGANRLASNSLLEAICFGRRVAEDIHGMIIHTKAVSDGEAVKKLRPQRLMELAGTPALMSASLRQDVPQNINQNIRDIMTEHVGLLRNSWGLQQASIKLAALSQYSAKAVIALMIAGAANQREESRGSHTRTDFPATNVAQKKRKQMTYRKPAKVI